MEIIKSILILEKIPERHMPLIGREEYLATTALNNGAARFSAQVAENILGDRDTARSLAQRLHHNSEVYYSEKLGYRRPASAYFTLVDNTLIIEWGEIDLKGNGKLHNYLNRNIDFVKRVKQGGVVRSGHIGWINVANLGVEARVALIDSLASTDMFKENLKDRPEYPIITTLQSNSIVPITTDGYPIVLSTS